MSVSLSFPALQSLFDTLSPPIHTVKHILVREELILHDCHSLPIWLIPCFLTFRKDKGFPVTFLLHRCERVINLQICLAFGIHKSTHGEVDLLSIHNKPSIYLQC